MARILVVDDEREACQALEFYLTGIDHEVETALDGGEGLQKLKTFRPHLVLLDVKMHGEDGLEVLPQMKAIDPHARVIMVTGVQEQAVANEAVRQGADEYITKPIDLDYLNLSVLVNYIQEVG
jgi:CheY-like chemotaxis protein